jgi:quercetin dioxygenase-like cupin family protein
VQHWDLNAIEAPDGTRDPVVLASADGGRAVLIVLQAGQQLGDHQVKEHAWLFVVEGTAQIASADGKIEAPPGTLAHFEPDERHSVGSDGGAKVLLLLAPWPGPGHFRGSS